jgi:type I restriction enzyme M protein
LNIAKDEIKTAILDHPEFVSFSAEMDKVFAQWQTKNTVYLKALEEACLSKIIIQQISEDLLNNYQGKELIDKYAIYQQLMDYWAETMQDVLYELTADGWKAGNAVTRLIKKETKKGGNDKKIAEIEGQLIPPSLIIQEYFETENIMGYEL